MQTSLAGLDISRSRAKHGFCDFEGKQFSLDSRTACYPPHRLPRVRLFPLAADLSSSLLSLDDFSPQMEYRNGRVPRLRRILNACTRTRRKMSLERGFLIVAEQRRLTKNGKQGLSEKLRGGWREKRFPFFLANFLQEVSIMIDRPCGLSDYLEPFGLRDSGVR